MRRSPVIALLVAASVSGCVLRAPMPDATPPTAPAGPDAAEMRLIEAAERAERALASLALALPAHDPASGMPSASSLPAALKRRVTLDWSGPLETLAADLARRAGYRFVAAGRRPARPLIVAVHAVEEPLIAVLRDAGLRAGGAAVLTVDAAGRTVLLDWSVSAAAGEDG